MDARGGTVLEVVRDLDTRVPGLANRVLDAGPSIRPPPQRVRRRRARGARHARAAGGRGPRDPGRLRRLVPAESRVFSTSVATLSCGQLTRSGSSTDHAPSFARLDRGSRSASARSSARYPFGSAASRAAACPRRPRGGRPPAASAGRCGPLTVASRVPPAGEDEPLDAAPRDTRPAAREVPERQPRVLVLVPAGGAPYHPSQSRSIAAAASPAVDGGPPARPRPSSCPSRRRPSPARPGRPPAR